MANETAYSWSKEGHLAGDVASWHYDIQQNDTQHDDTLELDLIPTISLNDHQLNDTQHQHGVSLCCVCFFIAVLGVVILNVVAPASLNRSFKCFQVSEVFLEIWKKVSSGKASSLKLISLKFILFTKDLKSAWNIVKINFWVWNKKWLKILLIFLKFLIVTGGLYYKSFTIIIYYHNDSANGNQYYKTKLWL
jgi:hypothetical protein